jgi:hypothetical protein
MHVVGRSLLAYSRSKESATEKLHAAPSFYQNLALAYPSSSLEEKLKDGRTSVTNKPTERNKDLPVIAFIKPAASSNKNGLHRAANQFFCLPLQTGDVLGEVEDARNLDIQSSVLLHQPASHIPQGRKPFPCKDLAPGGHRRLWPPLHVGCSSATWSLRRPPKLEATKRHPVGHLQLRFP